VTYVMVMVQNYLATLNREEGQGMAEYGLILALVAVLLITVFGALLGGIEGTLQTIADAFGGVEAP
jgi:pilus assembly protein Flp/PilA